MTRLLITGLIFQSAKGIFSIFRGVVMRNAIPHGRINNPTYKLHGWISNLTYKFPNFLRRYCKRV